MLRIDRYVLRQLVGPFLFFAFVLTGVIWLTQSLRVIDTVINRGQSALVFLEFSALLLPLVMSVALPISAFGAALYAGHRMQTDSEITVLLAAGMSARRLARPVAVFGVAVATILYVDTLYLMPVASQQMKSRIADLRGDLATALVRDGRFLQPSEGLTIYVKEIPRAGEMRGVFVHDSRDPERPVTYTAQRAAMVRDAGAPRLIMFDGVAQSATDTGTLEVLRFQRLVYDLTAFMSTADQRRIKPSERFLADLLNPPAELRAAGRHGGWISEGYEQLVAPLYGLALPLLGLAILVGPGHRRRGYERRLIAAIAAATALRILGFGLKGLVAGTPSLAALMPVPPLLAVIAAVLILGGAGSAVGRPVPREVAAGGGGAAA